MSHNVKDYLTIPLWWKTYLTGRKNVSVAFSLFGRFGIEEMEQIKSVP